MKLSTRVAGLSAIVFALAGLAWFAFEVTPVGLGFEDTDNPAVMVSFIRTHPDVYVDAGLALIMMAIALTAAVLTVADVAAERANSAALRWASAFGLFAAAFFLVHGGIRIGSSGPLLHIADLKGEWGEVAYLAAQVTGQALAIGGIVGLCLWAIGLSLIGIQTRVFPLALCALAAFPAIRLVTAILGPLRLLPDSELLWAISIAAIPGTMLWCLTLGLVLLRRGFQSAVQSRLDPATAGGA
ncbi:MAG: hypothetical protein H0V73_05510 [Chloroflexi bacterium]|nr:hypothetical protein [Chloroflexota bacterium]